MLAFLEFASYYFNEVLFLDIEGACLQDFRRLTPFNGIANTVPTSPIYWIYYNLWCSYIVRAFFMLWISAAYWWNQQLINEPHKKIICDWNCYTNEIYYFFSSWCHCNCVIIMPLTVSFFFSPLFSLLFARFSLLSLFSLLLCTTKEKPVLVLMEFYSGVLVGLPGPGRNWMKGWICKAIAANGMILKDAISQQGKNQKTNPKSEVQAW